eukprot:s1426_g9.t1
MENLQKELKALLSAPALEQRGHILWCSLAAQGNHARAIPVVLGCFFLRAAQSGVHLNEEVLRSFWPESWRGDVDREEAFLPLLQRCAESMLAAMEAMDKEAAAARLPGWLAQWMADKLEPQEDDPNRLWVANCSDPAVAALLCGSYKYAGFQNHGKAVYSKEMPEESAEAFYLYFWSDDMPDFQGWWFGPAVGGDGVVAFHPDAGDAPPQSGWRVPFNGEVDPNFEVTGQRDSLATVVPVQEEVPDGGEKAVTSEVTQQTHQETDAQVDGRKTAEAEAGVTDAEETEAPAELMLQPDLRRPAARVQQQKRSFMRGRMLKAMKRVPKELIQQEGQALLAGNSGSALLDALRGLLRRYTATELFRCSVASAEAEDAATVGMDDLDELLLRSEVTLPLEALVAIWHAALHEVGCSDVSKEAAPGIRLGYMQFARAFTKGFVQEEVAGRSPAVPAPPAGNFSFKAKGRHYRQDRQRRLPPLFSSLSAPKAKEKWDPLGRERSPGFLKTLTHLVSDLDEGSVRLALQMVYSRLGAQKIAGVFKDRHRCRSNLAALPADVQQRKVLKKQMAMLDAQLAEIIQEWHGIKSSPGPQCSPSAEHVRRNLPPGWDEKAEAKDGPKYRAEFISRQKQKVFDLREDLRRCRVSKERMDQHLGHLRRLLRQAQQELDPKASHPRGGTTKIKTIRSLRSKSQSGVKLEGAPGVAESSCGCAQPIGLVSLSRCSLLQSDFKLMGQSSDECSDMELQESSRTARSCCDKVLSPSAAVKSLLLGQLISVLNTFTGVFSSTLADSGINLPSTQSSLNYLLLALLLCRELPRIREEGLRVPWWRYALWALADVEANYMVVLAYRYTSVASVMLLDGFTVPGAMLVSWVLLRLTVFSDSSHEDTTTSHAWMGDLFVICGASLYSLSNVQEEILLKRHCSRSEALGMLGVFGSIICCVQAFVLEGHALRTTEWSARDVGCLLGFQICLFGIYVLASIFLQMSDSAVFNMSLLTCDVYSIIFSWQVQHKHISWTYGLAFGLTLSGLVCLRCEKAIPPEGRFCSGCFPEILAEALQLREKVGKQCKLIDEDF